MVITRISHLFIGDAEAVQSWYNMANYCVECSEVFRSIFDEKQGFVILVLCTVDVRIGIQINNGRRQ